jgi:hypothetical protein
MVKTHVLRYGTYHFHLRHSEESVCLLRGTKLNFKYTILIKFSLQII